MVEYITYKDKKYPVRLSYRVFKGMKDQFKGAAPNLDSLDPEVLETMLWYGLQSGHKAIDTPMTLTKENMEDVLDECFTEFLKIVPKFFPNAAVGNVVPDLEKPKLKKEEEQGLTETPT